MKTYKVSWVEYSEHSIQVEAKNEDEAYAEAFEQYDYGKSMDPEVEPDSLSIDEVK